MSRSGSRGMRRALRRHAARFPISTPARWRLEDETGQRFVIASMDIIAITPQIADPVADAVHARHGLARRQLLLAATHTHYGPEFRPDKQVFFNIPAEYAAKLPAVAEETRRGADRK